MSDELATLSAPTASIKPPPQQRTNPNDIRNADLVSRFLAATPPYLYSPPVGPHNFFFSDMLRSLVQAKTNEQTSRNLSQYTRRPRKRSWSRCMFDSQHNNAGNNAKEPKEPSIVAVEKPLELTNKLTANHFAISALSSKITKEHNVKMNEPADKKLLPIGSSNAPNETPNEPTSASLPPSDLILPPPPPMWYPPLYPPYGIDPLHFFIDLRVSASGHIYDRKKENISPSAIANNNENNNTNTKLDGARHGSAFSVPPPRREKSPLALNLSSSTCPSIGEKNTLIDYRNSLYLEAEKESMKNPKNTNYVLQNLPRIYTTMMPPHNDDRQSLISDGSDTKSESDLQEVDVKDEDRDDVVIVDCQDTDGSMTDNNNSKCGTY